MPRLPLWLLVAVPLAVTAISGCSPDPVEPSPTAPPHFSGELAYEIVATYPHLTTSFTQGLEFLDNGQLVESVGLRKQSGRAIVDLASGKHLSFEPLIDDHFGEGITEVGDELYQLTWLSETAIVASSDSLAQTQTFSYDGQGWGLCWTGTELAMSDGSETLTFRDPADFSVLRTLEVTSADRRLLGQFNELECVGTQIWANVFQQNHVVAIDSESGEIEAWADLSELEPEDLRTNDDVNDVLNGIAFRPETGTFFVTGKLWPEIYELRFSAK